MYEQDKTTKTWDCINAIPNSSPEKAIINANGNNPKIKKINPEFIILYVNPLSIFNSIWPLSRSTNSSSNFFYKWSFI